MRKKQKRIANPLNIFSGRDSIRDFLNPDNNPPLPLVEIPEHLNPYRKDGVRIFAKLMNFLPLANVKSLPAYNMLLGHEQEGRLNGVKSLIENSSGNTALSLSVIGRIFGVPRTKAFVSHEVTWGKLQLLRLFGVDISVNEEPICPDPMDKTSGIYKAKLIGKKKTWFNPGQYDNEANPAAHTRWTGPQIWNQTRGKISVFCAGLGTTGTLTGVGSYLKKHNPRIKVIGVARLPNNPIPGVRTPNLLGQITFDWKKTTDHVVDVGTEDSFKKSLELCRAGIIAGPSSGFALHGLLQFVAEQKGSKSLYELENKDGEVLAVFICPDSPLPYLNEYFEFLDESHFPEIENEYLLLHKPSRKKKKEVAPLQFNIDPSDAHEMIYPFSVDEVWRKLKIGENIPLRKGVVVVDIRSQNEFIHFHLPGSERIDTYRITKNLSGFARKWNGKKVFLLCPMGIRTEVMARVLRKNKIQAYGVKGGTAEWSSRNLPRVRPSVCN